MSNRPQHRRDYDRTYRLRPFARYRDYQKDAKKKGRTFTLTFEQFAALIDQPCHYCERGPERVTIGVDRQDPKIGYEVENCVPCCSPCNFAKGKLTAQEFFGLAEAVVAASGADYAAIYL